MTFLEFALGLALIILAICYLQLRLENPRKKPLQLYTAQTKNGYSVTFHACEIFHDGRTLFCQDYLGRTKLAIPVDELIHIVSEPAEWRRAER